MRKLVANEALQARIIKAKTLLSEINGHISAHMDITKSKVSQLAEVLVLLRGSLAL